MAKTKKATLKSRLYNSSNATVRASLKYLAALGISLSVVLGAAHLINTGAVDKDGLAHIMLEELKGKGVSIGNDLLEGNPFGAVITVVDGIAHAVGQVAAATADRHQMDVTEDIPLGPNLLPNLLPEGAVEQVVDQQQQQNVQIPHPTPSNGKKMTKRSISKTYHSKLSNKTRFKPQQTKRTQVSSFPLGKIIQVSQVSKRKNDDADNDGGPKRKRFHL